MGLEVLTGMIPAGQSRLRLGMVVTVGGERRVNVDGNVLRATWTDPLVVDDGDPVEVQIHSAGVGQSRVHVTGRATSQPRPRTGTVTQVPAGSPTITVEANGISYTTEPVNGPFSVGDKVHLDWGAGVPRAIGKVTTTTTAKPAPTPLPPPPAKAQTGRASAAAKSSRTYWAPGGWGSYAGDGNKVHQGTWFGATVTGAWFYGTPFKHLAGRKITRVQFRTGDRLAVGYHNDPAVFHFYAHTNPTQPGGDTNRVVGPHNVTIQPGQARRWIDLPLSFADTLINGGGIAIQGDPYAAMKGRTSATPDSGAILIDWEIPVLTAQA